MINVTQKLRFKLRAQDCCVKLLRLNLTQEKIEDLRVALAWLGARLNKKLNLGLAQHGIKKSSFARCLLKLKFQAVILLVCLIIKGQSQFYSIGNEPTSLLLSVYT